MIKSIRNTVLVVGLFLLATGLYAQTELRFDTWVSGNTREGQSTWYRVQPTQAGILVVKTTGPTYTSLVAYNASYESIGSDNYIDDGRNIRLELVVQSGRTYLFELTSSNSGPYQIRASVNPIPAAELRLDTDVSGNISEGAIYWYRVRAAQTGNLTVETNGSLDTYMEAYDESYNLLGADDDSGNGYNARLNINAVAGQSYLFKVKAFNNEISGPYRVWASHRGIAPMIAANTVITELRIGTTVSGNLSGGDEYWYSIRSAQAGYVTVETSGNIDTYLEVYDSSYNLFSQDDDGGEGSNAKIVIIASAGTTFFYKLKGYSSIVSGPYRISASIAPFPTPTELRFNASVSGNLREGGESWYSVRATENGYITVRTAGSTDTFLEVFDSSYRPLASDDDSGEGYNALVQIQVQVGQTYVIRLRGPHSGITGPYLIQASFSRAAG